MKEKCSLVRDYIFSPLLQSNLAIFCGNDTVLLRFTVTNKNADTFLPGTILFYYYFFVTFIVVNKKIVQG